MADSSGRGPGSVAAWFVGIALGAVGVAVSADRGAVRTASLVLAAVGFAGTAIAGALWLRVALQGSGEWIRHLFDYDYLEVTGDESHLDRICHLGRKAIGTSHATKELLSERLAVNQSILRVVYRRRRFRSPRICAYTLVYPLSAEADRRIRTRTIRAGTELTVDMLHPSFSTARCLYIAMILGTDRNARAYVKAGLSAELTAILATSGRIQRVYGRPASRSGLRLLKEYGFRPIAGSNDIWATDAGALAQRLTRDTAVGG